MNRVLLFLVSALITGSMSAREPVPSTKGGKMLPPHSRRHQIKAEMQHATKAQEGTFRKNPLPKPIML